MSEAQGQGKQSLVEMLKAMVQARASEIGRASCRERVCLYV